MWFELPSVLSLLFDGKPENVFSLCSQIFSSEISGIKYRIWLDGSSNDTNHRDIGTEGNSLTHNRQLYSTSKTNAIFCYMFQ